MLLHPHVSASSFLLGAVGEKERQGKASNCVKESVSKRNKGVSKRDKRQVTVSLFACVYRQESRRGHGQPSANVGEEVVLSSTSVATRSSGWKESLKVAVPMAGGPFRSAPLALPPSSFLLRPSLPFYLQPSIARSLARSLSVSLTNTNTNPRNCRTGVYQEYGSVETRWQRRRGEFGVARAGKRPLELQTLACMEATFRMQALIYGHPSNLLLAHISPYMFLHKVASS